MRAAVFLLIAVGLTAQFGAAQSASPGNKPQAASPAPPVPPAPPLTPPNFFRQLLGMSAAERQKALANRSARDRQVLEESIRKFEALTPEAREARLVALQRQLEFRSLIRFPASNRVEQLAKVPEGDRQWLSERLQQWDQQPPELQDAVMTNMTILRFLFPGIGGIKRSIEYNSLSRTQQAALEKAIIEWNRLPPQKRQAICELFKKISELDDEQRAKTLEPLSVSERAMMERALKGFENLPGPKQEQCIAGFQKFANLSAQERQEFLRNANQWEKMSPQDRQTWRSLVSKYRFPPPPMPPVPRVIIPAGLPMPPAPPAPGRSPGQGTAAVRLLGTNP